MSYISLGGCNAHIAGGSAQAAHITEVWVWHFWANRLDWKTIHPRVVAEKAKIRKLKEQYDAFQYAMTYKSTGHYHIDKRARSTRSSDESYVPVRGLSEEGI